MSQGDALEKLKTGELAATILIAGKPAGAMGKLKAADGFRFLPVPFAKPLQTDYLPALLGHNDYPGMVESGQDINTIAVGAVLIAYNWPKDSIATTASPSSSMHFFRSSPNFRNRRTIRSGGKPILPLWCRAGTRFPEAQEWLERNSGKRPAAATTSEQFDQFLTTRGTGEAVSDPSGEHGRLFQEFLQWQARQH